MTPVLHQTQPVCRAPPVGGRWQAWWAMRS